MELNKFYGKIPYLVGTKHSTLLLNDQMGDQERVGLLVENASKIGTKRVAKNLTRCIF